MSDEVTKPEAAPQPEAPKRKPFPLTAENVVKVLATIKQGTAPAMSLGVDALVLEYAADDYALRVSADTEALRKAFPFQSSCVDALPMGSQRVTFAL